MHIHNMMEEIVIERINQLNDRIKEINPPWFRCSCENCRMDAVSYVLNRIPPKYVVSGRGVVHSAEVFKDGQLLADIDAIGIEGIRTVNSIQRPDHIHTRKTAKHHNSPLFNFPIFTGCVLDGTTFEPLSGASIKLMRNGTTVIMKDSSWANPCKTYHTTKGVFSFWLKPEPTDAAGVTEQFDFSLEISADGYESINYGFTLQVTSEDSEKQTLNSTYSYKIRDLFMFRTGTENPME
ncbi:late competence development ComFB family protein [Treponema parvum]|uniref:Late competence development ComFB family protein n=1 Tax=Treponema parvum TaxID=138851 RepID=A0A975EYT0_9SPIR|nr:late competence development ComFB family protein [Treponema parvum]QTQ11389.1 late competence development ComFB family protein [Treponema parvum]QTQ16669.1 late competence development ComFB family protein [Treponema parvum]